MDTHFDVLVIGTGLTESIAAAALAQAGYKVLHIDANDNYGADESSLSPSELDSWTKGESSSSAASRSSFSAKSVSEGAIGLNGYSLSLAPSILPSTGPLIVALVESGVSRYGGFKLLEGINVFQSGTIKRVPGSKEDIFKSKDFSLVDKRKLMRFLVFAAGKFEESSDLQGKEEMVFVEFLQEVFKLGQDLAYSIAYAVALCTSPSDKTLSALLRMRTYLLAAGRYGPSSFLVGQYGGLGEIAQGFCRSCAVNGGTYILGRKILSLVVVPQANSSSDSSPQCYEISLENIPDKFTADFVICSTTANIDNVLLTSSTNTAVESEDITLMRTYHQIAVTDQPIQLSPQEEATVSEDDPLVPSRPGVPDIGAALLIFPPESLPQGKATGPVTVFVNGSTTMSCPKDRHVLYLSTMLPDSEEYDPRELLAPYLSATLAATFPPNATTTSPLLTASYVRSIPANLYEHLSDFGDDIKTTFPNVWRVPPITTHIASNGDMAVRVAEELFWAINEKGKLVEKTQSIWPEREYQDEE